MSALSDRLKIAKIRFFGNPVGYSDMYYQNSISVILQSDFEFFQPYITAVRNKYRDGENDGSNNQDDKLVNDCNTLTRHECDSLFGLFDGSYAEVVSDDIIDDPEKMNEFFRKKNIIIGPEVDYSDGKYLHFEGSSQDRLDIFGDPVIECPYNFHPNNTKYFDEDEIITRIVYLTNEDRGIYENVEILPRNAKFFLLSAYENDDSDVQKYFTDGALDPSLGFIFVRSLDDGDAIKKELQNWIDNYISDTGDVEPGDVLTICEKNRKVSISDKLDFTYTLGD